MIHLIWAADLKTLYKELNQIGLDSDITNKINTQSEIISSSKPAESSFIMYAAVDRSSSYFKDKGGAHLFYTKSKQGLGDTSKK